MKFLQTCTMVALVAVAALNAGCSPKKAEAVKTVEIPDGTIDPAVWGEGVPGGIRTVEEDGGADGGEEKPVQARLRRW